MEYHCKQKLGSNLTDEYSEKEDLIRVDVIPQHLSDLQERLNYSIVSESSDSAIVSFGWEKIKVALQFQIK